MFNEMLNVLFAPLLELNIPALEVFIIAVLVSFLLTLPYKFLVDQKKMREHKEKVKEMQKRIKEAQKTDQKRANELMTEMLGLSNKQMMTNFKPMIPGMILVILFLPWVAATFTGPVALLPFSLYYFGNDFGWLVWYMIASLPATYMFRKMLGVQ